MAVKYEIKSQLAKLLATEDLIVEHKQVETAQFNVDTRVLILPLWEKASNTVYDMLVGHEVGHALFTPNEDPPKEIPHQFINVVEDARIEKLMKRKYMGIAKTFYNAYNELHDKDFFDLEDEDIDTFNLADRVNLFYKIGSFADISFSTAEKEIVDMIGRCETFDDAKKAAFVLYEYCKKQLEEDQKTDDSELPDQSEEEIEFSMGQGEVDETDSEEKKEKAPEFAHSPEGASSRNEDSIESGELEVQTAETFDGKIQDLAATSTNYNNENIYVELPKLNLDTVIASNSEVHQHIDEEFAIQEQAFKNNDSEYYYHPTQPPITDIFQIPDQSFIEFKKNARKEVSYLVKEFESRKSASAYARASTSRTGVLDTTKLQTYRFNEDLFKKVTVLPDGKNHGLVFVLDWSGSMCYVMEDTLKQLYNLIWFCKKVQIPFEVYAFTNEWLGRSQYEGVALKDHYERREGLFHVESTFSLMNLFTSKTNAKDLDHQMKNVWRLGHSFGDRYHCAFQYPRRVCLSGTPLNESLVALHQIIPKFQKENGVEKTQCIVLTDGEAHQLPYDKEVNRSWEDHPYLGTRNVSPDLTTIRDRKLGTTYRFGYGYHQFTDCLLINLKDNFPSVNFIGIRVLQKKDGMRFARMYYSEYDKAFTPIEKDWRRTKTFVIKNSGYDAYFAMCSNNLADDSEFDVDHDATKAQIKRAFVKSLKIKKLNKKILGEFISLVV